MEIADVYDPTPPPFGEVTRKWTQLPEPHREEIIGRLLDQDCGSADRAHVDHPGRDEGVCYRALVTGATADDELALAWLATAHRPLLLLRGRALFEHDPTEWGGVCLEVLFKNLVRADLRVGMWLRRRVSSRLATDVSRATRRHLAQRKHEPPTDPSVVIREANIRDCQEWCTHLEASADLDLALGRLPAATQDGLLVVVTGESLADVARAHGLSYAALRQRVSRARRELRDQLARYHREPSPTQDQEEMAQEVRE